MYMKATETETLQSEIAEIAFPHKPRKNPQKGLGKPRQKLVRTAERLRAKLFFEPQNLAGKPMTVTFCHFGLFVR